MSRVGALCRAFHNSRPRPRRIQIAEVSSPWVALAGTPSFVRFRQSVQAITGLKHVIPTHQGRAAERILFNVMCKKGDVVPNNTHFDTTRANCEAADAEALDPPIHAALEPACRHPFKGNMDTDRLADAVERVGPNAFPWLC